MVAAPSWKRSPLKMRDTVLMILPPEGKKYGFPVTCPPNWAMWDWKYQNEWLVSKGYPESLITKNFYISLVHIERE
jgi:hypothetical protein|tara:strand:- start:2316 stop:2543 length:228 start_codon:yes stop_codon:yes gene_type:complete